MSYLNNDDIKNVSIYDLNAELAILVYASNGIVAALTEEEDGSEKFKWLVELMEIQNRRSQDVVAELLRRHPESPK